MDPASSETSGCKRRIISPVLLLKPCTVLNYDDDGIALAASMLRAGQCVAFPTETVYGLGANAFDVDAILRIFQYKGRPLTDPLIVHVPDVDAAMQLVELDTEDEDDTTTMATTTTTTSATTSDGGSHHTNNEQTRQVSVVPSSSSPAAVYRLLASSFWPGPLTLVAKGISSLPSTVMAGTGFVGVRVPANAIAQRLLIAAKIPVAAPSANRFGHVSPTRASHVIADLGQHPIGVVLCEHDDDVENDETRKNGASPSSTSFGNNNNDTSTSSSSSYSDINNSATAAVGIESTVLKVVKNTINGNRNNSKIIILRRGGVSVQQIEACLRKAGLSSECVQIEIKQVAGTTPISEIEAAMQSKESSEQDTINERKNDSSSPSSTTSGGGGEQGGEVTGMEAPGMLLTHYAPDVETFLVTSVLTTDKHTGDEGTAPFLSLRGSTASSSSSSDSRRRDISLSTTVVIDFAGMLGQRVQSKCAAYVDMSPSGSVTEARRCLFDKLRWSESIVGATAVLLADPLSAPGTTASTTSTEIISTDADRIMGEDRQHLDALRDRMYRAASGKEVHFVW